MSSAPAERTTSFEAKYCEPVTVSMPIAVGGDEREKRTFATWALVKTVRLGGAS